MKISNVLAREARRRENTGDHLITLTPLAYSFLCAFFAPTRPERWLERKWRTRAEEACFLQSAAEYAKVLGK